MCTLSHQPKTAIVLLKTVLENRLPHKTIKELVKPELGNLFFCLKVPLQYSHEVYNSDKTRREAIKDQLKGFVDVWGHTHCTSKQFHHLKFRI